MGTFMWDSIVIIGMRFNDEIYFYLSRGLIDPSLLETIPNQQVLTNIIMAPSMILRDAWEGGPEYRSFYQQVFNNLHEDTDNERKFLSNTKDQLG